MYVKLKMEKKWQILIVFNLMKIFYPFSGKNH